MKKILPRGNLAGCICMIMLILVSCSNSKQAASGRSATEISRGVDSGAWVFTAEYVLQQGSTSGTTNGFYNVILSTGKLVVALPYFGTAYAGVAYNSVNPLDFISTDFTVRTDKKEGKWQIDIKPNDKQEVQSMTFTFFDNGSADLNVTLTNRSFIGFRGSIAAKK